MAFNYFTIDSIRNMEVDNISQKFIDYYNGLTESLRNEIRTERPDIASAIETENECTEELEAEVINDKKREIINRWNELKLDWSNYSVKVPVLYTKTIPNSSGMCSIHRKKYEEKNVKFSAGKIFGVNGLYCAECNSFYIRENRVEYIKEKLEANHIDYYIAGLDDTLNEIESKTEPVVLEDDAVIYIPEGWKTSGSCCPVHPETELYKDRFVRTYKERRLEFYSLFCKSCNHILMSEAGKRKLEDLCDDKGIPPFEYKSIGSKYKSSLKNKIYQKPHFIISDGNKSEYKETENVEFKIITENDRIVINYSNECMDSEHQSEYLLAVIKVQKRDGSWERCRCLTYLGYCSDCEQYTIEKSDYEVLLRIGRPEADFIDETDSDYSIISGAVFNEEKDHLSSVEDAIDNKINSIKNRPDFVERYAVSRGYDDGDLAYNKRRCKPLYEEIEKYDSYKSVPYRYRSDLTSGENSFTTYLGYDDIKIDGEEYAVSFNSPLGRKLVNYRTIELDLNGKKYKVKRRREFDIANKTLFSFTEQSDEDLLFQSGIRDNFLIKVLKKRKKQHKLLDILSTVQEKQDEIIDAPVDKNMIVQGCAGSGKTMVLLHRLSIQKYNENDFDFENAVILTPNNNFTIHISGLASSLQLGYISRVSVEEYYKNALVLYDKSFDFTKKITDEMNENQDYVDFVYTDEFLEIFKTKYTAVIDALREQFSVINKFSDIAGTTFSYNNITDSELLNVHRQNLQKINAEISKKEQELQKYTSALESIDNEIALINEKVDYADAMHKFYIQSLWDNIENSLTKRITLNEKNIADIEKQNDNYMKQLESDSLKTSDRLSILEEVKTSSIRKTALQNENVEIRKLLAFDTKSLSHTELRSYIVGLNLSQYNIVPDFKYVNEKQEEFESETKNLDKLKIRRNSVENQIRSVMNSRLPDDILKEVSDFIEEARKITPKRIYDGIYEKASVEADELLFKRTSNHYINKIRGIHRYDLYLQLIFSMMYFDKKHESNSLICIDEGQDLAVNEYKLLRNMNEKAIFNIYGDTDQLLKYGRGIYDWNILNDVLDSPSRYYLYENYRNTNQITQYCNDMCSMKMRLTGVDGKKVHEIERREFESKLSEIRISDQRIGIILPRTIDKEEYIVKEMLPDSVSELLSNEIDNGKISVVYVDEVKGIEFEEVFVVPNGMTNNERYIAFTRALEKLTVVNDRSFDNKIKTHYSEDSTNNDDKIDII